MSEISDALRRAVEPIRARIRLIVARGRLTAAADDSQPCQTIDADLLAGESRTGIQRVQQYGFSARPPAGAEALVVAVGGQRDHLVAVAVDDRAARPRDLAEGECCLWTPDHGRRVHCRADGQIDIGRAPEDFVALSAKVDAELDAIKSDLGTLKAAIEGLSGSLAGTVNGSTPFTGTFTNTTKVDLSWSPSSVAAEEVRAR